MERLAEGENPLYMSLKQYLPKRSLSTLKSIARLHFESTPGWNHMTGEEALRKIRSYTDLMLVVNQFRRELLADRKKMKFEDRQLDRKKYLEMIKVGEYDIRRDIRNVPRVLRALRKRKRI
ncbi:MAG: hypothetical protein V1835_07305 [Candidatus Micrarchaeota archaeon]